MSYGQRRFKQVIPAMSYAERRRQIAYVPRPKPPAPQVVVSGSEQLIMEEQFVKEFKTQMATEETKARQAFERDLHQQMGALTVGQRQSPEAKQWMAAERAKFETGLQDWRQKQLWQFQKGVGEWREEYIQAKREYHPSIAEMMLGWAAPVFELGKLPLIEIPVEKGVLKVEFDMGKFISSGAEATVAAGAGFVGSVESLVYPVMGVVGFKTPAPPPTLSGAVIETGIKSIIGGKITPSPQFEEIGKMKYPVSYVAGSVLSDIIIGYGISKGVEKAVVQPVVKAFKHSRLEKFLIQRGIKIKEGVPIVKGYWAKKAAREIAPQIVSFPRLPEKMGMEFVKRAPAVKGAWDLILAPKSAGLLITPAKAVTPTAVKALPRLTAIGVMGAQPFVRYAMPPQPPVKMKPMMDIMREPTGFQRYKWTMPVTKELSFVKGKLPSLKDLLTELAKSKKGQVMLPQLITVPKKIVSALPQLSTALGVTGASPLASQILGAAGFLALKTMISPVLAPAALGAPTKPKAMPRFSLADLIGLAPAEVAKEEQEVSPVAATITEQVQEIIQVPVIEPLQIVTPSYMPPPFIPTHPPPSLKPPPRRRAEEEELKKRGIKRRGVASLIFGRREYEFPTTTPRGVAAYVFGRRK